MKLKSKRPQTGALLIELVFSLAILLPVVFAIVHYSILLGALLIMNNATSEAARQTTVFRNGFTLRDYENFAREALIRNVPRYVGDLNTRVTARVASQPCGEANVSCFTLTLEYPNYENNPLIGTAFIPLPTRLFAESVTRVEHQ